MLCTATVNVRGKANRSIRAGQSVPAPLRPSIGPSTTVEAIVGAPAEKLVVANPAGELVVAVVDAVDVGTIGGYGVGSGAAS
jgi:hypothetical protein